MDRPSLEFRDVFGWDVKVVSTIDHPYPSPPIHLFDGHLQLQRKYGDSVLIMNWDVSHPLDRFYRYDLITDSGLIAKEPKLYHYHLDMPYSDQHFDPDPWLLLPRCIECAVFALQAKHKLSEQFAGDLVTRTLDIVRQSRAIYSSNIKPWQYTAGLLKMYYEKLQQPQLRTLIERQYCNYWMSPITRKWIPWCLAEVDGAMAFRELQAKGVFRRATFRLRSIDATSESIPEDTNKIAEAVAEGILLPSLDVFYWSLAIARIRHYGNDFGFFARLASATGDPSLEALQCTKDEEDSRRFLKFDADYGILLDIENNDVRLSRRINQPVKLTRVTSFSSVLVALGDEATEVLQDYANGKYEKAQLSFTPKGCSPCILVAPAASPGITD
jgi:hypothetical protein